MKPITLQNYAEGKWVGGVGGLAELRSAIDGEVVALTSSQGLDFAARQRARLVGLPRDVLRVVARRSGALSVSGPVSRHRGGNYYDQAHRSPCQGRHRIVSFLWKGN